MITVYSSSTCPACEGLKMKLRSWEVEYTVRNLDTDADAKHELLQAGFRTVPQLKIGDTWVQNVQGVNKDMLTQ